jgi:hypothetical protein
MTDDSDPTRREIERWFLRRGAPHFIEGYRATTRVWTRAFPLLAVLWVAGLVAEIGLADNTGALAFLAGCAVVVGFWVLSNLIRRRRPFAQPDTIGPVELVVFAVAPAVLSFALDARISRALFSLAIGVALLIVVYLATSYGLVAITRYVLGRLGDQLVLLGQLSSRAIPLLLLITVTIFCTGETWQMSSRLVGASQFATLGLFVMFGGLFLLTRVPGEVRRIEQFDDWETVRDELADTPAAAIELPASGDPDEPRMNRGQRINLLVIALTTQAVQITLVAVAVYAFFVLLGLVAVHPETAEAWIGNPPTIIFSASLGASKFALTEELLRVSGFLAAFSGLAFTVYLVTDSTYRAEFASDVSSELRQVLAVRMAYVLGMQGVLGAVPSSGRNVPDTSPRKPGVHDDG